MRNTARAGVRHARNLYRGIFRWALRPVHKADAEVHHLREVEQEGESGETPFVAILGLILFLLPIFVIMLGLALLAAHLAG